jgi:hypothetical protein
MVRGNGPSPPRRRSKRAGAGSSKSNANPQKRTQKFLKKNAIKYAKGVKRSSYRQLAASLIIFRKGLAKDDK